MDKQLQFADVISAAIFPPYTRPQIIKLVRRWGSCTADAVLDPATLIFSQPDISGFIGYRKEFGCAIVFGDPVCSPEQMFDLAEAFTQYCKNKNLPIIYIAATPKFAELVMGKLCHALVEFGKELYFDPYCDPRDRSGTQGSLVRRKVKHALRDGAIVKEYTGRDEKLEQAIRQVGDIWLSQRSGPQMHISHVRVVEDAVGKRIFYATLEDRVVGIVVLNQLEAYQGWLLNHLMVVPEAPSGTPELLLTTALEAVKGSGCRFVTVGAVPRSELGQIEGLNTFSTMWARIIFKIAYKVFHLGTRNVFWGKFYPEAKKSYLLFSRNNIGFAEIKALYATLNGKLG